MDEGVIIHNLELSYESGHSVISDLSSNLTFGKIYGLLGLNGAGKTTLFKALSGLIKPKKGYIHAFGYEPFSKKEAYLKRQMLVPITTKFPEMSVNRFVKIYSKFWPNFSIIEFNELMEKFQIDPTKKLPSMSTGERKKCMTAFALSANTTLLMLDEPMAELDIISRKMVLEALVMNHKPDRILIISSNQVEEFENIYTDILILYCGRLLINSSIEDLTSKFVFHQHGDYPNAVFEDGLKSICLNTDHEYSDIDLTTLFYAVCSSEKFRKFLLNKCD